MPQNGQIQPSILPGTKEMEARARRLATIATAGFALMVLILIAFHFIQPELNPLKRFGSEYAVGRLGWLMNIAFFCFAGGLLSLAFAFNLALNTQNRSLAGVILFVLAAIGIFGSGLFNTHLQGEQPTRAGIMHALAGFLAFLTMIPAMFIFSRRFRLANLLKGEYGRGIWPVLRYFPWLVLLLFLAMLFVFEPLQLVGLGQRLFLAAMFTWLLSAAHAIRSGAFTLLGETRGAEEER